MITNFSNSQQYSNRAEELIPGGGHTYSKGKDQFASIGPRAIVSGKGARVVDVDGNEFIDWGMGLTSVILGHAYEEVVDAIKSELSLGSNFIIPSHRELELAELLCEQIPCAEMVKFGKNGSDVTSAAVRLARAYTGKKLILHCKDQPFFSQHDWFIGTTACNSGIPEEVQNLAKGFKYNDIEDLKRVIDENRKTGIACLILQPVISFNPDEGYLQKLRELCTQEGIVLIFDEVVTGFRMHPKGAQFLYNVTPDLAAFGKAMANGFSFSCLAGKKEIMHLGGLNHTKERVFLLSSTYGGETHHILAAKKTLEILNRNNYEVTTHLWNAGEKIKNHFNVVATKLGIQQFAKMDGFGCKPFFMFLDKNNQPDMFLRTLFLQETVKRGMLFQVLIPSFSHKEKDLNETMSVIDEVLKMLAPIILENSVSKFLSGQAVKPVFRKFN